MSEQNQIIIGARGSELSLIQVDIIKKLLKEKDDSLDIVIKEIKTEGDKNQSPIPLDIVGKGWFTHELEEQLSNKSIDMAIHSLKDLPENQAPGLMIKMVADRADARDALVSKKGVSFKELPSGSVIGTDSFRRSTQILSFRPDLAIQSVRGNVGTRLKKLHDGNDYDAIILAVAGLDRLGMGGEITEYLDPTTNFIPSPGQGALAAQIRLDDEYLKEKLAKIEKKDVTITVTAERAFSKHVGGGCKTPIGAYATIDKNTLTLYAMLGCPDGSVHITDSEAGNTKDAAEIGKKLAVRMLEHTDAQKVLQELH